MNMIVDCFKYAEFDGYIYFFNFRLEIHFWGIFGQIKKKSTCISRNLKTSLIQIC